VSPGRRFWAALVAVGLGAAPSASSAPITYAVRAGDSTAEYAVTKWSVFREQGRFRRLAGTIVYDAERPEASRVTLRVDVGSLDSGARGRDETLLSADFFDAARFPEMRFTSASVRPGEAGELLVTGDLVIRGRSRRLTVPVQVLGRGRGGDGGREELAAFETRFTIDRRDFDVLGTRWSGGQAILGHEVEIHLVVGAYGPPASRESSRE
jgi:polyisoprenoid-binding protein YceI